MNYLIHTDAIKENLIPENISKSNRKFIYADEADLLNIALFGKTAKEWREENPELKATSGIMRHLNNWLFYPTWKATILN